MTPSARAPNRRPAGLNDAAAPTPRPGWYAYDVTGAATLPTWAVEVALTVERPVAGHPDDLAVRNDETPVSPPGLRDTEARTMALLRAPGRSSWLAGIAEAASEIETAAGVRRPTDADRLAGNATGSRSGLLMGPALPGLVPIPPAVVQVQLGAAGARGLAAPLRRWRPAAGRMPASWRAGAGSVLICDGPSGVSAQAVVALAGAGSVGAITPRPGGALVLRAWRARSTWGAACGLVLGAAAALGLGREAGRAAAHARAEGWDAAVLQGSAALSLARAGDHRRIAPEAAARIASAAEVAALFEACLTAGGLGRPVPAAGPSRALAVTL